MKFINEWEVLRIHDRLVAAFGGLPGMPDSERISAILARIENRHHYEGVTDLYELAATYWVAIARGHIFNDGNKRTALAVTLLFLARHNVIIRYEEDDQNWLVELTVKAATGEVTPEWLAERLRGMGMI